LHETASYEPSCVKISSVVFPVEDSQKEKGKERYKKSHKYYISLICGEAFCEQIFTKFCVSEDMPKLIICAKLDVKNLKCLEYKGSNFVFSH